MKILTLTVMCVLTACFFQCEALPGRWGWLFKIFSKTPKSSLHNFQIHSVPHISNLSPSGNAWRKGLGEMSMQPAYNPHFKMPKVQQTDVGSVSHNYPASQGLSGLGKGGQTPLSYIHSYPPSNGLSGGISSGTHAKPVSNIPSAPVEEIKAVRKPPLYEYNGYIPMPIDLKTTDRQMNVTAKNSNPGLQIDILLVGIFTWSSVRSIACKI